MPGISLREAIRRWEQKNGISPQEATEVSLECENFLCDASLASCNLVYKSYGIWNWVLPYLERLESTKLQATNQFFYNHAIGRVQNSFVVKEKDLFAFSWSHSDQHNKTMFFVTSHKKVRT